MSHLQQEITDLINILSIITKRAPELEDKDDDPCAAKQESEDLEVGDQKVEEVDFEVPVSPPDEDINALKRNALDRLAEVLARFKTAGGSSAETKRNSSAKHVASVAMVEALGDQSVTFLCAKNEGLDAADVTFLRDLKTSLQSIAAKGKTKMDLRGFSVVQEETNRCA